MTLNINQAIFMTNTFAEANPERHVELWEEFEQEVPVSKRSGYFGADNVAYIAFLRKKQDPTYLAFFNDSVESRG